MNWTASLLRNQLKKEKLAFEEKIKELEEEKTKLLKRIGQNNTSICLRLKTISSLETKIKGLEKQLSLLEEIINKPTSEIATQTDFTQEDLIALERKVKYHQKLSKQKDKTLSLVQQELKNSQTNNEELEKQLTQNKEESHQQLRQINLLFDDSANSYEIIAFDGLYSLLASIAEREREQK